jgi:hypothetical protein
LLRGYSEQILEKYHAGKIDYDKAVRIAGKLDEWKMQHGRMSR